MKWILVPILFLLVGCQMKPTKVSETQSRDFELVVVKQGQRLTIGETTVVLDARPAFDYGLNRIEGSFHLPWENLAESAETGEVMRDKRRLSQRLALLGLTPDQPVVVVGNGPSGDASEGRVAWTLLYVGYRDVQTASVELFRKNLTQRPTPTAKNIPPADLEPNMAMITPLADFKRLSVLPKERLENHIWIIDVRSEREYFNKEPKTKAQPDIGALHIEWKQFYNRDGRPNPNLRKKLKGLGIKESDRVILVSNRGVRSAAAAYALIALGFRRAENFLSGYRSLNLK